MVILFRVLATLHGVLNPPYTGNSQSGGYSLFLTVYTFVNVQLHLPLFSPVKNDTEVSLKAQ